MNVADTIRINQDKDAMLSRAIETQVKLYAEKTHFIYELLQNAEDAGASSVHFHLSPSFLDVLHDGKPFTLSNAQSLCDAANSDKKTTNKKIGKFGVGFKSVFAICETVYLYSEPSNRQTKDSLSKFAIKIEHYTNPVNLDNDFSLEAPFTTKFRFPLYKGSCYKSLDELYSDIFQKLASLGSSVLLFMKNIENIHYQIDKATDKTPNVGSYSLIRQYLDENICKVIAHDASFLVFSKPINGTERSVDIAFSINDLNGTIEFTRPVSPYVFAYYPTETESKLNFIVQAPFDLTPNRSSLERNSERNSELTELLVSLFRETITSIKNKNWLTLDFLNLLPFDSSDPVYAPSWTFYQFHKSTLHILMKEKIIPTLDNDYVSIHNATIHRSSKLLELLKGELLCDFLENPEAKWLPQEFTENSSLRKLHGFLKELGAKEISSNDLPKLIRTNPSFLERVDDEWLVSFYNYLATDVRSLLGINGELATVPFVKTSNKKINAPYIMQRKGHEYEKKQQIYRKPKISNFPISDFLFVDEYFEEHCNVFVDLLCLPEPDNFDYFISELNIVSQHMNTDEKINSLHVKEAIKYLKNDQKNEIGLISEKLKLKVTDIQGNSYFRYCRDKIYRKTDLNGISLVNYFGYVTNKFNRYIYYLDEQFYLNAGLSLPELGYLKKLGVKNNVYEYINQREWKDGNANCSNRDDFRKNLTFTLLYEVLESIKKNHYANKFTLVQYQSAALFFLLRNVEKHLFGEWQYRSTNPIIKKSTSIIVEILQTKKWLLDKNDRLVKPNDISRFDLNENVYGKVEKRLEIYELLGFKKTERDKQEEIVHEICSRYTPDQIDAFIEKLIPREEEFLFDPDVSEIYKNFPEQPIKNLDRLIDRVSKLFMLAPNVRYEHVRRRIRISRSSDKEHIKFRYMGYCQRCENPHPFWEVAEIFINPKKELNQMNLSLCPGCASQYRIWRNDITLMETFKNNLNKANIHEAPCYVAIKKGETIRFTQAHLAEIQQIIKIENTRQYPKEH